MQTKEIDIKGKKFTITELRYKDLSQFSDLEKTEASKKLFQLSTGLTDNEYDELSMSEGITLQKSIDDINGFNPEDFHSPPKK